MGNCLVTKLKESVNNNNLSKVNELLLSVKSAASTFNMQLKGVSKIIPYGGYFMTTNGGEHITEETTFNPSNLIQIWIPAETEFKLGIYTKYDITTLFGNSDTNIQPNVSYKLDDIQYMNDIVYLGCEGIGNIKSLEGKTSLYALLLNKRAEGELSNLSQSSNLTNLKMINSYVTGNVSSIASITTLANVDFTNSPITGKVEEFVAAQVTAGKASGRINWTTILRNLSFGSRAADPLFPSSPFKLIWESASKIHVDGQLGAYANTVYCYGYSDAEIETNWSGKTVIKCD